MFGRRRDEQAWERWERMAPFHGVGPVEHAPTLMTVQHVRQLAHRGSKAYGIFPPYSGIHAVWCPDRWLRVGEHAVVTGHFWSDTGTTHHQEVVFVIDVVHDAADATVLDGWRKHERRRRRRQRREDRRIKGRL
jgi:hypothetical protein